MLVYFSLLVCSIFFGIIFYFQKKRRHCIKQACMPSMASTSTSSSSSTPSRGYEVFLSFHGKDTRTRFTDHLHHALKRKFDVFRDDENLKRGEYFPQELLKAIQKSKYGIPVISENYAFSKWCLIELAEMVKCTELTVLPIFYHVNPSDVGNLRHTFATAFDGHEKDPKVDDQMISKWKDALKKVSKINGWHVNNDRYETEVIKEICDMISDGLNHNFSTVSKDFVGIESRVNEIMTLLSIGSDDVRFIGICGMGGIGKTTLSTAIYESVSRQFEASCFIEEARSHSLVDLQKQLISHILKDGEINIWNSNDATRVIVNRFRNKRVLIVLDDVDAEEQIEALAGSHDWFGQGSRIIITSRDCHLLNRSSVNNIYDVKLLYGDEALELFSKKAFKKPHPEKNYVELSKDIVSYAEGLPLALKVFGSMLFGRKMDAWKSARDLLKENPYAEILDKLQISYDGLMEYRQKQLFLDIAFFFVGTDMDSIKDILESFGYYPDFDIEVLEDKSLITISNKRLRMHDLLQKMGQKIVRSESLEEPGKRSRLCHDQDVIQVLKNDSGTDAVRGTVLNLPLKKPERLNVEAFSKMKNLKMLQIGSSYYIWLRAHKVRVDLGTVEWHGDASNFVLSNKLCVMEWCGYPCESLPTHFQSDNLVELIMRYNCIKQLWVGRNSFPKLKYIDLCHSQNLIETPDLSGVPNLQKLILEGCTSLSKVHRSIGSLRRLTQLNLRGCSKLNEIPDSMGNLTSLRALYLDGTAIKKILRSFKRLTSLERLNISNCSRLEKIPKNLFSDMKCLWSLDLSYCNLSDGAIPSYLSCLSSVCSLNLRGNKFTRLPDSVGQLSRLFSLNLSDCSWLQVLPKLPLGLGVLSVRNCPSLDLFYKQMDMWRTSNEKVRSNIDYSFVQACIDYDGKPIKILHLHPRSALWSNERFEESFPNIRCGRASLVGLGIPEWFNDKSTNSSFGTIRLHSDFSSKKWTWLGYAVFIVYEFHDEPHTHTHPRKRRKVKVEERKGNSNSTTSDGTNSNFPFFVCHFQTDGVDFEEPLVLCAPGVPPVGPNGFWAYIAFDWFYNGLNGCRSLGTSITTGSLNVEVKECGARVVRDIHDYSELNQVLNTSYEYIIPSLHVWGPIIINKSKVVASGSIGSVNYQHLLKKSKSRKIRLIGNRLTGIKGKQKTLPFPSQWIRGKLTKKRRRKEAN